MTDTDGRLKLIEERNSKVTADKAWETSKTRRGIIFMVIYLIVGIYLSWLHATKPWLSALVPPSAFLVSTLGLQLMKRAWINRYTEEHKPK